MKTLLLMLVMLITLQATDKMFLMTTSYHTKNNHIYNNLNFGIGYEYTSKHNIGYQLGIYRNSEYNTSQFVGVHYQEEVLPELSIGVAISVVSGYETMKVIPMPLFMIQYKNIRIATSYPLITSLGGTDVINLQFVFEF